MWLTELPEPPPSGTFVLVGKGDRTAVEPTRRWADVLVRDDALPDHLDWWRSAIDESGRLWSWRDIVEAWPHRRILVPFEPLTRAGVAGAFDVPERLLDADRPS